MREVTIQLKRQKRVEEVFLPVLFVLLGTSMRLLPHPANIAPIAAMALFGGVYLDKKYAIILPLVALFLSDVVIGFYPSMLAVYGSFMVTGIIGLYLRKHKSVGNIILGSLVSSLLFFLITNFGFWLLHDLYPKTFAGQMDAYVMALPFFRNTLIGDLLYVGVLFGTYEVVKKYFSIQNFTYGKHA